MEIKHLKKIPTAQLLLTFSKKSSGATYISEQYYNMPLQILEPFYIDDDGSAFLYMLNPSGGMLDNDYFNISFTLNNGAQALISTPSANKIYKTPTGSAKQKFKITLSENSSLEYLPRHNVPYANSSYEQETEFYLKSSSTLFTWDILSCGRALRGEKFDYTRYKTTASIYADGKLILKEKTDFEPLKTPPSSAGIFEDKSVLTVGYAYKKACAEGLSKKLRTLLKDKTAGATAVNDSLTVIKILSNDTSETEEILLKVWQLVRNEFFGKEIFKI